MTIPRDRWPTLVGLVGAFGLLVVLGVGRQLREVDWWGGSFLGLDLGAWALATTFLTVFLIVQIVLNARATLTRERRLVEVAAELRETSAELERLAMIDPLTGVLNRRAFFERLDTEFRRSQRYARSLTVVMVDVDHFKDLNDRYGHATGDSVLAKCAELLAADLRQSDEVGRYGGEEFAILLPETSLANGVTVAEKLRMAIDGLRIDSPDGGEQAIHVTISAGVASYPSPGATDGLALLDRADRALYEAKHAGRNRVEVDQAPVDAPVRQRTG